MFLEELHHLCGRPVGFAFVVVGVADGAFDLEGVEFFFEGFAEFDEPKLHTSAFNSIHRLTQPFYRLDPNRVILGSAI